MHFDIAAPELVRETRSTHDADKHRLEENLKIVCGAAHFNVLGEVGRLGFQVIKISH